MYRAKIENLQSISGYPVPFWLRITNNEGADFQLHVDRYWTNVDPPAAAFILTPPE